MPRSAEIAPDRCDKDGRPRVNVEFVIYMVVVHGFVLMIPWFVSMPIRAWWWLLLISYLRMLFVSAVYHRYFSHRSFATSRHFQLILTLVAMTSMQRGVLWWASIHRNHHRCADGPGDVHSPRLGYVHAFIGWLFYARNMVTNYGLVRDFSCFPELVFLNRHYYLPATAFAAILYALWGVPGLYYGYALPNLLMLYAMGAGNTLGHSRVPRNFETKDQSSNSRVYAVLTLGEYHNNHHAYPVSSNQALCRWEVDGVYWMLVLFEGMGLIWNVRRVPPAQVHARNVNRS